VGRALTCETQPAFGKLLVGRLGDDWLPAKPTDPVNLFVSDKSIEDLWIAITWKSAS